MRSKLKSALKRDLRDELRQLGPGRDDCDWLWNTLETDHYPTLEVAEPDDGHYAELVDYARLYIRGAVASRGSRGERKRGRKEAHVKGQTPHRDLPSALNAADQARVKAMRLAVALDMATFLPVLEFRERYLGKRILSNTEALDLLWSPAASLLALDEFQSLGVSIPNHRSKWDVRMRSAYIWHEDKVTHVECDPNAIEVSLSLYPYSPDFGPDKVWPLKNSVLADLWKTTWLTSLAYALATEGDRQSDILWFILTNQPPAFVAWDATPLNRQLGESCQRFIRLDVPLWFSAGAVAAVFTQLRNGLIEGRSRGTADHGMNIFAWVAELQLRQGMCPPWKKLAEVWNLDHPDDPVSSPEVFEVAYENAKSQLLSPRGASYKPEPWLISGRTDSIQGTANRAMRVTALE